MSYVRKIINSKEKLLLITRPHWIYIAEGCAWLGGFILTGFIADYYLYKFILMHDIRFTVDLYFISFNQNDSFMPWIMAIVGAGIFWPLLLVYVSVEIGLTSGRIIYKKGLLFIEVDQVDLDDIRAEQVYHGWLGWLLGYGKIHLDCRFVGDVWLPAIRKSYHLLKIIHIARMHHPDIDYDRQMLSKNIERIQKNQQDNRIPARLNNLRQNIIIAFFRSSDRSR